jgi:hypothetical protein
MSATRGLSARAAAALLVMVLCVQGIALPPPAAGRTAGTASVGPFTFQTGPYQVLTIPDEQLPYFGTSAVIGCGLTDPTGVAMHRAADGVIYNHPVAQAQCAINMQRNYRLDPDPHYLQTSIANAERLLSQADAHRGGLFFPYPFRWSNPSRGVMQPPWYSSMAQGLALMTFVRLYELTGEARWMDAARQTFASYKVSRAMGGPWHVVVENGQLWLDEYPSTPPDKVFNGHNFSLFGLYDYWRVTNSSEANALIRGALNASYIGGSTRIRVPGGISQYCSSDPCLEHQVRNPAYHGTHIGQLTFLFLFTGHWHFASLAEAFTADAPRPTSGRARLAAGAHDGYAFDSEGNGTRVASVGLPATTTLQFSRRDVPGGRYRPGNGIWLRISEGALNGLWVRESSRAVPLGFTDVLAFHWNRPVQVAAGTYTGTTYDGAAAVTGSSSATTAATTWWYTDYRRIDGRPSVRLSTGPLAGTWLSLDRRTTRDTTLFTDIDASLFRGDIIWLNDQAVTKGCATYRYCPTAVVSRQQMASFLTRALGLPTTTRDFFTDDESSVHEGDINRLAAAGITGGCAADRFCPVAPVTRGEMASFLARALRLPGTSSDFFSDDERSLHEGAINRLAAAGITGGCADGRFCPEAGVTRGEMAAFLRRALARLGASTAATTDAAAAPTATPSPTPSPSTSPTPVPTSAEGSSSATPAASPTPVTVPSPTPVPSPSASEPTPTPDPGTPTPSPSAEP